MGFRVPQRYAPEDREVEGGLCLVVQSVICPNPTVHIPLLPAFLALYKMIYQLQFLAIIVVLLSSVNGLQMGSMKMALSDYKHELAQTAKAIAAPGKPNQLYDQNLLLVELH